MCPLSGIFIGKVFTPVALEALEVLWSGDHLEQAALGSSQASPTGHQEGRNRWGWKGERREKRVCSGSPRPSSCLPAPEAKCFAGLLRCAAAEPWRRAGTAAGAAGGGKEHKSTFGAGSQLCLQPLVGQSYQWLLFGTRQLSSLHQLLVPRNLLFPRIYSRTANIPPSATMLHPWILSCTLTSCSSPLPQHRKDNSKL